MLKIKEILNKKYYIREIILLGFIVLALLYLSIYTSFAIFEKTIEKTGAIAFEASEIMLSLSSDESSFAISDTGDYGTITVPAGETKAFDVTVTNETPTDVKYKTWYRFTSGITILDVEVGISSKSENESTSLLSKEEQKVVRAIIVNNSSQSATIDIGVSGGYKNNEVILGTTLNETEIIKEKYKDISGANEPVLADGMIPVIYDVTNAVWVKASITEKWYDYNEQMWANAVTVTSTNRETYLDEDYSGEIPMEEINSMWVWIPRYKYKISSNLGSSNNVTNPPQIDIIFEKGTDVTGVSESIYRNNINDDGTNINYYTHPAFRNISNIEYDNNVTSRGAWDEEITGFWAAKFEASSTNSTCNTATGTNVSVINAAILNCADVNPIVKPNVNSLRYQTISTQFLTSLKFAGGTINATTGEVTFTANKDNIYGLNTDTNTTDSHMMKNTEWGAVAILSQSQYGKMGNSIYTELNKEIYINKSKTFITGNSSGTPSSSTITTQCAYNDIIDRGSGTGACGTGASTTGTIYGLYDMNGGSNEYTMQNWGDSLGSSEFESMPTSKYYDFYNGTSSSTPDKNKIILGDATWETMKWYSDGVDNIMTEYPWGHRGSSYNASNNAGIFQFYSTAGSYAYNNSWRPVLMP